MSDVLIVDNDPILREALAQTINQTGHSYLAAKDGKEALAMLERHNPSVVVSSLSLNKVEGQQLLMDMQRRYPGVPVILMAANGSIEEAITAIRRGAVEYLSTSLNPQIITEKINRYIKVESIEKPPIAKDPTSLALFSMALRVAETDVGVLISGESGTGKEVLSQFIHENSARRREPFIAINCAAIPEQMLEATLFGYEKGAFTGAYKTTLGKFEQAEGGTLLLDEVSEMSLPLQAKLLRVLQEKEVERIGSNKLMKLNVRVLATTNRLLEDEIAEGRFREDLFYRLNVFPLHVTPLRERKLDIIPLTNYLIDVHCRQQLPVIPHLADDAIEALIRYPWPGNTRELNNVVQRALVLQTEGIIHTEHLQLPKPKCMPAEANVKNLQLHEYDAIEQTLRKHQGNRQLVAASLGVSDRTLRYKLAKMREAGYAV